MRATVDGRDGVLVRVSAWALGALGLTAAALASAIVWKVLVDPLAVARLVETFVGRR
jgi:hypothetical protein